MNQNTSANLMKTRHSRPIVAAIIRSRTAVWGKSKWLLVLGVLLASQLVIRAVDNSQSTSTVPQAVMGEYNLADFGPVKTIDQVQVTLNSAITNIIARGGGILVIGPGVAPGFIENNAPSSIRGTSTVTIVDRRNGYESVLVPSNGRRADDGAWAGWHISHTVRQPIDGTFGVHSTAAIDTTIAGGTASYYQPCLLDIQKGRNQRIYGPTIRGLFKGMHLVLDAPEQPERVVIKSLGWDAQKKLSYVVADIAHDHPKGTMIGNKDVVNSLAVTDRSQSDNQSMGLIVHHKNYGNGDSLLFHASAVSQGNIMSAVGDEGGVCYGADISNDLRPFRGKVESINWKNAELVYEPGDTRNSTLGTSRPLINMNTNKWIRQGAAYIVYHLGCLEPGKPLSGGAVIGSKDCGWTPDIIGRFFACDEPSEYFDPEKDFGCGLTSGPDQRTYRWWQIDKFEENPDGTKRIWLQRVSWNVDYWTPGMLLGDWWSGISYDGKLKLQPMRYIIAPGAYVAGVAHAWTVSDRVDASDPRTLKLGPSPDAGGKLDFEKGDSIVQAIGQCPWNVVGLRVRHHNYLPSTIPDASFQAVNLGRVTVDSALQIQGGNPNLEDDSKTMKGGKYRFARALDLNAASRIGIRFGADVREAAILFEQPHDRAQLIRWCDNAILGVDPKTGEFFMGRTQMDGVRIEGTGGISGSATPARNLRGIAVPVKDGETEWKVSFECPETNAQYALAVRPTWTTASAVVGKTAESFTVRFARPAPRGAAIDWFLVR